MKREIQAEVVNVCIVNALRLDDDHRMMLLEKLTQRLTDEHREKLINLITKTPVPDSFNIYDPNDWNEGPKEIIKDFIHWYNDHHPENHVPIYRIVNYLQEKFPEK